MNQTTFRFWGCPECRHAENLNLDRMTNTCRRIDQGESPVDGAVWEFQDHDICPVFQTRAGQVITTAAIQKQDSPIPSL